MARPVKSRHITGAPASTRFIPAELWEEDMPENVLKMEELEALRLKDLEGYEQEVCAIHMAVSRPTFQRILLSAREKVADSLLHGKAIRIDGGDYTRVKGEHFCRRCGRSWENHARLGTAEERYSLQEKLQLHPTENSVGMVQHCEESNDEIAAAPCAMPQKNEYPPAEALCPDCDKESEVRHGGGRRGQRRRGGQPF